MSTRTRKAGFFTFTLALGAIACALSAVACHPDGECSEQGCDNFGGSASRTVTACYKSGVKGQSKDEFVLKDEDGNKFYSCSRDADDNDGCGVQLLAAKQAYCHTAVNPSPSSSGRASGGAGGSSGGATASMAGQWVGTWTVGSQSGSLTLSLTQSGAGLHGGATFGSSTCLQSGGAGGSVSGSDVSGNIAGGAASGADVNIVYEGDLDDASPPAFVGTFHETTKACGGVAGTFRVVQQ
jgi:hypothetical protein